LALTYPVLRSRSQNLLSKLMLQRMWLEETYGAVGFRANKDITGVNAALNHEGSDALLGGGYTGAGMALYFGDLSLDTAALAGDVRNTEGRFTVLNYNLSRLQTLARNSHLFLGAAGQLTDKNLDPVVKLALGGPQGVRAYAPAEIIADEGAVIHAELRYSPMTELSLQGFYDWGWGRRNKQPDPAFDTENIVRLAGYGVGLFWDGPQGAMVRASVAWPTTRVVGTEQRVPQIYVQVSLGF
jgi:hemolysin activation/secretion protein